MQVCRLENRIHTRGMSLRTVLSLRRQTQHSISISRSEMADMPKSELDGIDRRIIAELQADARLTNVELADRVGLSPSPCLRRVKRLEREGYIEGYRAALRRDRVGLGFSVFLAVKIDGHANERALKFEDAVSAMPEVIACHLVSGEADYLLEVVVPDLEHYQRFLLGRLLNLPIVREVKSNIAIQTVKAGAPLPLGHLG
jgi:Lrp/AsnC family transcriptional regulator, leucine-responsive regulatory protein